MQPIYLDNNATTALDPLVLQVGLEELTFGPSNPSSVHGFGRRAKQRLIWARDTISARFKVKPTEVIFTSGASEALNMVLRGLTLRGAHVITSSTEHPAVFNTLQALAKEGVEVTFLNPGPLGAITLCHIEEALRPNTKLIVLMAANNETGVKSDLEGISAFAHERNILFLVDAVAWIGKEPFVMYEGISALCFSGHKFHAPKGIGCAIVRKNCKFNPLIMGGHQEFAKRGGTENLFGIVCLAKALELINDACTLHMKRLRDKLEMGILTSIPNVCINGEGPRIVNTSNLSFLDFDGETLLMNLDLQGVFVSHGSACSSGALEPSRVLLNMGLGRQRARSALRFSLSRMTKEEEIDHTLSTLRSLCIRLLA